MGGGQDHVNEQEYFIGGIRYFSTNQNWLFCLSSSHGGGGFIAACGNEDGGGLTNSQNLRYNRSRYIFRFLRQRKTLELINPYTFLNFF